MANIQPTVDALDQPTVMLQIRKIAGTVDSNLEAVNDEMTNIQEQIDQMEDVSGRVTTLENEMDTVQSDLTAVENKNTEQDSAISDNAKGLITASELTYAEGVLTLKLTKQNGNLIETVDVPFFKTVTLIPTSTERAFKLQFTMWDDSVYDTNEFVIPAGGGTEVSVTGVTVGEGASDNTFKVSIQLSDASTIASNDYPFPESVVNPYPTSATLALSGNTLNLTIGLSNSTNVSGSVDLSPILASYATQAWVTRQLANYATNEDLEEIQVQITGLKLTSSGNTMSINGTTANIINSISGQVTYGNLKITVNGVESGDIPLPESGVKGVKLKIGTRNISFSENVGQIISVQSLIMQPAEGINTNIVSNVGAYYENMKYTLNIPSNFTAYEADGDVTSTIESCIDGVLEDGDYTCALFGVSNPSNFIMPIANARTINFTVTSGVISVTSTGYLIYTSPQPDNVCLCRLDKVIS